MPKVNSRSVKMIVLLHIKVLLIHRQENNTNSIKLMSVSGNVSTSVEFGSIDARVEDGKYNR